MAGSVLFLNKDKVIDLLYYPGKSENFEELVLRNELKSLAVEKLSGIGRSGRVTSLGQLKRERTAPRWRRFNLGVHMKVYTCELGA